MFRRIPESAEGIFDSIDPGMAEQVFPVDHQAPVTLKELAFFT